MSGPLYVGRTPRLENVWTQVCKEPKHWLTVDPSYEGDNEQNALACADLRQAASGMSEESAAVVSDLGRPCAKKLHWFQPSPQTWGRRRTCLGVSSAPVSLQAETGGGPAEAHPDRAERPDLSYTGTRETALSVVPVSSEAWRERRAKRELLRKNGWTGRWGKEERECRLPLAARGGGP